MSNSMPPTSQPQSTMFHTVEQLENKKNSFQAPIGEIGPMLAGSAVYQAAVCQVKENKAWSEPKPLLKAKTQAQALRPEHLPTPLNAALKDISERLQVPLEFVAGPTVVALAAVIGKKRRVCPLRVDPWQVIPNLWGMIIAEPGSLKSPAFSQALSPLNDLIHRAQQQVKKNKDAFEEEKIAREVRIQSLREAMRRSEKKSNLEKELVEHLIAEKNAMPAKEKRYLSNDPTVEKLAELLVDNTNGLLIFRDELSGWLESLARSGREGSREFYLEAWNGDGSFTVDRIGRGTIYVADLCLSLFGGIQPVKIRKHLYGIEEQGGDDGLLERFQVMFFPDQASSWQLIDRKPNTPALDGLKELFFAVDNLRCPPTALHFEAVAQKLADIWRCELENKLSDTQWPSIVRSHLSKYRSLMPTLALIFQLCKKVESIGIEIAAVELAIAWCEILHSHALKVYEPILDQKTRSAEKLASLISQGKIESHIKLRDLARRNWAGLKTSQEIEAACNILADHGWIQLSSQRTKGGDSPVLHINPKFLQAKGGHAHE